ncbi:MAG: hypothetical protein QXG00_04165 [Candidatus Woesearchaeota archaeon]
MISEEKNRIANFKILLLNRLIKLMNEFDVTIEEIQVNIKKQKVQTNTLKRKKDVAVGTVFFRIKTDLSKILDINFESELKKLEDELLDENYLDDLMERDKKEKMRLLIEKQQEEDDEEED